MQFMQHHSSSTHRTRWSATAEAELLNVPAGAGARRRKSEIQPNRQSRRLLSFQHNSPLVLFHPNTIKSMNMQRDGAAARFIALLYAATTERWMKIKCRSQRRQGKGSTTMI